ncbi:MAG TPA: hypothetical protein DD381_13930 [Lentisphaeria bacterium]|nr:MAG: hypothetical protein A2X47_02445 [Lentisphaerae bacterium GWF2_38_69]HBM17422.1 hypothetical protein [Lentisphaeria bacterium]
MVSCIENKLIQFGYTGQIKDLVEYAGSEDGLVWYWENYLEKIVTNAKGYYSGAFIRYKIKDEAKKRYSQHLEERQQKRIQEAREILKKLEEEIQAKKSTISLLQWFKKYYQETDMEQRTKDFDTFIEQSGFFEIYSYREKHKKLQEFLSSSTIPSPYGQLFRSFMEKNSEPTPELEVAL